MGAGRSVRDGGGVPITLAVLGLAALAGVFIAERRFRVSRG
jgi:hypothetical protein